MELLELGKPIKKPPRSDERDGELFCGTLPDTLTLSAIEAYSQGGHATITVPHAITDNYTKFALTNGEGYLFRDALSNSIRLTINTKYDLASYPFSNWMGTASGRGYGYYASITFYKE